MSSLCFTNVNFSSILCSNCTRDKSNEQEESEADKLVESQGKPTQSDVIFFPVPGEKVKKNGGRKSKTKPVAKARAEITKNISGRKGKTNYNTDILLPAIHYEPPAYKAECEKVAVLYKRDSSETVLR
jgi:hypothetical protein